MSATIETSLTSRGFGDIDDWIFR